MKGSAMPPGSGARNGSGWRGALETPFSRWLGRYRPKRSLLSRQLTFRSVSSPVESVALAAGFPAGSRTTAFRDPQRWP